MKAKIRILSMLLTVLMIVGMLPLALFAVDGDTASTPISSSATVKDFEDIKTALYKNGLEPYIFQSFENIQGSEFTNGIYDFPAEYRKAWGSAASTQIPMADKNVDFSSKSGNPFELYNVQDAYSIRIDENGNKALYLGVSGTGQVENWFDIGSDVLGIGNDAIFSVDFKMDGSYVNPADESAYFSLFNIITRTAKGVSLGKTDCAVIGLYADGGIFLWDNEKRSDIVGYLSSTEYTRIAVETDLRNNKYYVYINDVLVNAKGSQLISDKILNYIKVTKGVSDFTYTDFSFDDVRVYNIRDNYDATTHTGMWMDNILLAGRMLYNDFNSLKTAGYKMDLSGVTDGEFVGGIKTSVMIPGTSDFGTYRKATIKGITSVQSQSAVVYRTSPDGNYIQYRYPTVPNTEGGEIDTTEVSQAYMTMQINGGGNAFVGQNLVLSASFKAGSEEMFAVNGMSILAPITRVNGKYWPYELYYESDGTLRIYLGRYRADNSKGTVIGKIPTDKFINIAVHIICNTLTGSPAIKIFIDGAQVYSALLPATAASNWTGVTYNNKTLAANTPIFTEAEIIMNYNNVVQYAKEDICVKDVHVYYTDAYNKANGGDRFYPFGKEVSGFVTTAGISRYVENGVAKAEDFVLNGEAYKVGQGSALIGKVSDGVTQTLYAPYVDWAHSGTLLVNEPVGAKFYGSTSYVVPYQWFAYVKDGINTAQGLATLYTSFTSDVDNKGNNSFYDYGLGNRRNNSNLILDFDLMLGHNKGQIDILALMTKIDPNASSSLSSTNRKDTYVLRIIDGWLTYGTRKIAKLSETEFTRVSVALKTPDTAQSFSFISEGTASYSENTEARKETVYSYDEWASLESKPQAKGKTPDYGGNISYNFSSVATSISNVVGGKRTLIHSGTGTVKGTYTEVTVVDDGTQWTVTEMQGTVTRADSYERTTVQTLNGAYSIYVNGVQVIGDTLIYSSASNFKNANAGNVDSFRMFQCKQEASVYIKDYYLYEGKKPQQFITMENGKAILTADQSKTPATATDLKCGFIAEDGVLRFYDELGLPVIGSFTLDGKQYATGVNGNVMCNGSTHIESDKGICLGCGAKLDGITSLYGNSLTLGYDVAVNFYLDIDVEETDGACVEVGRTSDYENGTTVLLPISELDTKNINGTKYYIVSFGVPAKDIGMNIIARLVKDGKVISTEYAYSAQTYINTVLGKPIGGDITKQLKDLVTALDVYGKNAAAVLVEGAPIPDTITGVDFSNVTDATGNRSEDKKIRLENISLDLKSNIKIRVYFTVQQNTFTVKINEKEVNAVKTGNNVWCIQQSVVATELYDNFTFTITSAESYLTLNISALYYAKIMNEKAETEEEKNLMKAIKLYADAAVAYVAERPYMVSIGDSITYGANGTPGVNVNTQMDKPYPTLVAEALGYNVENLAVIGSTLRTDVSRPNGTIRPTMHDQIAAIEGTPDIISIMGGVNDASTLVLGSDDASNMDTTTLYGSLRVICTTLKSKYPDAFIFFITPLRTISHQDPTDEEDVLKIISNAMKKICAEYDIPVYDAFVEIEIDYTNPNTSSDGTHLAPEVMENVVAPKIIEFLQNNYNKG